MSLTITRDRTAALMQAVDQLTKSQVLVGIPGEAPARKPEKGEPTPPSNAVIGYLMETGAPERNLPARPFLVPGIEAAREQFTPRLKKAAEAAITGDAGGVETQLQAVGLIAQNAVRAQINDGTFAPLAARTLAARRARGRTGDKPLIDTGQLRNSITYAVQSRGV